MDLTVEIGTTYLCCYPVEKMTEKVLGTRVMKLKFFEGMHGRMSYVLQKGESGRPLLVFMAGFGTTNNYLELKNIARRTDSTFSKLFIDRLGVARSDETSVPRTWQNIVAELHELIRTLHEGPILFFAHSANGPISLAYALSYPDQVTGLILNEPTTVKAAEFFTTSSYQKANEWLAEMTPEERYEATKDQELTPQEEQLLEASERAFSEGTTIFSEYLASEQNLKEISTIAKATTPLPPILLFAQPFREQEYRDSEYAGEKTKLCLIKGHHALYLAQPDSVATAINDWLKSRPI